MSMLLESISSIRFYANIRQVLKKYMFFAKFKLKKVKSQDRDYSLIFHNV